MAFELETATKARLADVIVLSQKNREPGDDPGAKVSLEIELPNRHLLGFDGALLSVLYRKDASTTTRQPELDGVEPVSELPNLTSIGAHIRTLRWDQEYTGYRLVVDQGLGGEASDLQLDEGTLSRIRISPKDGGTFTLKCEFESPNVDGAAFGVLAKLKSREVDIRLTAPEVEDPQTDVESWPGKTPVAPAPRKKARRRTATEAFVDAHGIPE